MRKLTKVGLPNTCFSCGKDPGSEWYAEHDDKALSGEGYCEDCQNPPPEPEPEPEPVTRTRRKRTVKKKEPAETTEESK